VDTSSNSELSTNISHELVIIDSTEQGNSFVATVDTFAITTQGLIGPAQAVHLPIEVSGSFTPNGLTISNQTTGQKCGPVQSVLFADLYNLLIPFPQQLSVGTSWRDSVEIQGCPAGIPTRSHTTRSFAVAGEVVYEGRPVLMVQRADTTHGQGDGGLSQHKISIDARGTGTAVYYLDVSTGRIAHLTVNQILTLAISTSSRQYQLKQDSKQEFEIVR
jgi:hypothetical protein